MREKIIALVAFSIWAGICLGSLHVSAGAAFASGEESAARESPPLEVQVAPLAAAGAEKLRLTVRNISGKDVSGYVVVLQPADGSACCRRVLGFVYAMASPPRDRLRPGEIREETAPDGSAKALEARLDYVLFADGSHWGPDGEKQSLWIRGVLHGARGTYAQLKRVLETQGAGALAEMVRAFEL